MVAGGGMGAISGAFMSSLPTIEFDMPGAVLLAAGLNAFSGKIRSFREPLERAVRQVIIPSIDQNFAAGGRPSWAPLSPTTIKQSNGSILIRTGALRQGATQLNNWTYSSTEAMMSQLPGRVWYGAIHQEGSKNIPARPFAMIQAEDETKVDQVFEEWLIERLGVL